jgi:DNA-binding winged helix-turn-helix (wHTH) protein
MIAAEHVMQSSFAIRQFVSVRRRNMLLGARGGSSRPDCQASIRMKQYDAVYRRRDRGAGLRAVEPHWPRDRGLFLAPQAKLGKRNAEPGGYAMDGSAISFGPCRLLAAQRLLLEGDKPVRLGSRAFDILTALVERAGEVVSKEELIARAWPKTFVEEANLKLQVSTLRRALGDGQGDNRYVATVSGRGYNFVAPIRKEEPSPASPSPTIATAELHNLPFATTRMIGREEIVTTLVTQLSHQRLVTVVGPSGIGKTTVGLAIAERMIGAYEHGVWLVDLAPLGDPGLVPSAPRCCMCGRPLGCKRKSEKSDGRVDCDHVSGLVQRGAMTAGPDGFRDPAPNMEATSRAAATSGFSGSSVRPIVISFSSFTPAPTRGSGSRRRMPVGRDARHRALRWHSK